MSTVAISTEKGKLGKLKHAIQYMFGSGQSELKISEYETYLNRLQKLRVFGLLKYGTGMTRTTVAHASDSNRFEDTYICTLRFIYRPGT